MIQCVIAALTRECPHSRPSEIVRVVHAVLLDNVRRRMGNDEYATLSVMCLERGGRCVFAGAHEYIIMVRAASHVVECLATPGPWGGGSRAGQSPRGQSHDLGSR